MSIVRTSSRPASATLSEPVKVGSHDQPEQDLGDAINRVQDSPKGIKSFHRQLSGAVIALRALSRSASDSLNATRARPWEGLHSVPRALSISRANCTSARGNSIALLVSQPGRATAKRRSRHRHAGHEPTDPPTRAHCPQPPRGGYHARARPSASGTALSHLDGPKVRAASHRESPSGAERNHEGARKLVQRVE